MTPTRITYDGHLTLDLEFHMLIRNLLRRLSLLYYFHCGGDPSAWDFKGIIASAQKVKVKERNLLHKYKEGLSLDSIRQSISKIKKRIGEQLADEMLTSYYAITTSRREYANTRHGVRAEKGRIRIQQ